MDAESKTGTCSICGPTTVVRGGEREARKGDDYRWRCIVRARRNRDWYLRRDYNLTRKQYEELFQAQGGRCAICRKSQKDDRELAVDHCHDTGRVRGLLCWNCNSAIGLLGDTLEGVMAAADYLRRSVLE